MQDMRPPEDGRRRTKDPDTEAAGSQAEQKREQTSEPKSSDPEKDNQSQKEPESGSASEEPRRRSIRNVSLSKAKRNRRHHRTTQVNMEGRDIDETLEPRSRRSWWPMWLVAAGALVILVFALSTLFTRATITVRPAQIVQDLELELTASRSGQGLTFETVSKDANYERTVSGSETETVSEKASGQLTVFNDHSEKPMHLVPTTRFESKDGQVYRSPEAIRIPGRAADGTPGQTTVTVVAQEPGEAYNRAEGEFRLPGLKGDPSYDGVYAEAASPISGGLEGERLVIPDSERQTVKEELQERARNQAASELRSEVQADQLLWPELVDISFGPLTQKAANDDNTATLSLNATVTGAVFAVDELLAALAEATDDQALAGQLRSRDLSGLNFDPHQSFAADQEKISGQLSGQLLLVQEVDEEKVVEIVQGKAKEEGAQALTAWESLEEVEVKMTPFWLRSFPSKAQDIKVDIHPSVEEKEDTAEKGTEENGHSSAEERSESEDRE